MLSGELRCIFFHTPSHDVSVPNVWVRPNNQRSQADAAKARLTVPDGDHLTLLNVYNNYMQSAFSYGTSGHG